MNTGCHRNIRSFRILLGFFVLLVLAGSALAQTPESTCVNDSLYLISPDFIGLRHNSEGRPGMEISWADLDPAQATCMGLIVPDTFAVELDFEGQFKGRVDRIFRFTSEGHGEVGGTPFFEDPVAMGGMRSGSLRFNWVSQGSSLNGSYQGSFNLANNGGILKLENGLGGTWAKMNGNIPSYWFQVNVNAIAEGDNGVLFAGLSSGSIPSSESRGLFKNSGDGWESVGQEYFPFATIITTIAVSPTDGNMIAVGTERNGLYISHDGGLSFENWTVAFDPDYEDMPTSFNVSALQWNADKLLVALPNFGIFSSTDNGISFETVDSKVLSSLDSAAEVYVLPIIRDFTIDPSDSNHYLAGLVFHGVWESFDAGVTWTDLYGDLNVPDPENPGAWVYSAFEVIVDANDPQIIIMGCEQRGLYRTIDGGATWSLVGVDAQPENSAILTKYKFAQRDSHPGEIMAFEDNWGLIYSTDSGATWNHYEEQPTVNRGFNLIASKDGQDYIVGTTHGGVYVENTPLILSGTYTAGTSLELQNVDLGIELIFGEGEIVTFDTFDLVCQTFQGWAVWRSLSYDRDNMTLIGFYDKVNPEDCIQGYCGDVSYELLPNCFAAKKAACFNFDTPDTIRFFDQEVYEGFSYYYSVTSFDYGNTALMTPQNNTKIMVFSPRWDMDPNSPYIGDGNRVNISINSVASSAMDTEEIYVFPNPLREGVGIPGTEGETVVFTNLPAGSRVRVFTTAGDDVINLGPDNQVGGNIRWRTRNRESERVSAGVYLYKVEMPTREDYWGRLVIIR